MSGVVAGRRWRGWRSWSFAAVASCLAVAVGLLALWLGWSGGPTGRFVVGTAGLLAVHLLVVAWAIHATAADVGTEEITIASWLTLLRGVALAVLGGFLVAGRPAGSIGWLPGLLFGIAAAGDAVDGVVARATDSVTDLGGRLDVEVDGLTVLVGTVYAVAGGWVPVAYLLVGLARYAFVAGLWWRDRRGRPVYDLPPSQLRRVLGAAQMAVIFLALLPTPGAGVSSTLAIVAMLPLLLGFGRDWLAVTGVRRPDADR